jgi:hypothetical protein
MQRYSALRSLILLVFFSLVATSVFSQSQQRFTVSGYVYEKGSRETLIGVNVYEPSLRQGSTSNTYGFYAITLPAGEIELFFSYVGYQTEVRELNLASHFRLDIELQSSVELQEVVVSDEYLTRPTQVTQMSRLEIPISQALNIPSLLGEKDLFKVLQLMPGVQSGTEGTSGFYVRGGGPDQNLIILDDAIVYNASHLFGFFSVFNGDAVKNMELYKGGFPARFGGRLSSVLDIQMKDGNKERFAGEAGIGLISSRLTLEGPIVKDKASFLVSGRRTYIDILTRPLMDQDGRGGYFFYDLNTKLNYDINQNNRIFASAYFGRDKFYFIDAYSDQYMKRRSEGGLYWQNATATLRWNHIFNQKMFANASLIFSDYTLRIYNEESWTPRYTNNPHVFELKYSSGIRDLGLKYDLSWFPLPGHHFRAGFQVLHHTFTPSAIVLRDDDIGKIERNAEIHRSLESGIYVEDIISISDFLKINPGLRYSLFTSGGRNYQYLEPRISSNLLIFPEFSWKASFASMTQYVHLLSTTGIGLPTDLWVPSTEVIEPQKTWQLATGFAYDLLGPNIEISLEGYYKKSDRIIGYREGASFLYIDDPENAESFSWEDNITRGEAWAYGLEFLVHRKQGKFSGWVGYTLSWAQQRFDELNFGEKFWARYDRRHDISLVGIYQVSPAATLSATWVYATGNAFDLSTGRFPVAFNPLFHDHYLQDYHHWWGSANIYDKKNSFRAASYHRLDFGVQFHKQKTFFGSPATRTIEIGLYNAYSRKNPFFYFWQTRYDSNGTEFTQKNTLMQVSLFPVIPSITYNLKF